MNNLIVVTPLPGEFVRSHLGRARRLNRKRDQKSTINAIRAELSATVTDTRSTPVVRLLATFGGVSDDYYCKQHTMLALTSCIVDADELDFDGMWPSGTLKRVGATLGREAAYFCQDCVDKDMKGGLSYWRRDHQVPGLYRCSKHGRTLRVVVDADAFNQQPSSYSLVAPEITCLLGESGERMSLVARYEEIVRFFLDHDHLFDGEVFRRAMSTLGREFSTSGRKSNKPLLSALARTKCPPMWLEELIPGVGAAGGDEFFAGLDYVFAPSQPMRTVCYALALALLFDSATDAIRFISPASRSTDEQVRQLAFPSSLVRVANRRFRERCHALIEHDCDFHAAAAKIGVDPAGLKDHLSRRSNGLMRELAKSAAMKAVRRFSEGTGLDDACTTEGVNRKAAEGIIQLLLSRSFLTHSYSAAATHAQATTCT